MGKTSGQLGTKLEIVLPSYPLSLRWSQPAGVQGKNVVLEFQTIYVGDGAPVSIQLLDGTGGTWKKLNAKIFDNLARINIPLDSLPKENLLVAVARIEDLSMELRSEPLPIKEGVAFLTPKLKNAKGEELKEISLGDEACAEATLRGAPVGSKVELHVELVLDAHDVRRVLRTSLLTEKPEIQFHFAVDLPDGHEKDGQVLLDKYSQKYKDATLRVRLACLGSSLMLPEIPVREDATIEFEGAQGNAEFTLADGSKRSAAVPEDGVVVLEKVPLGDIVIDNVEAKPVDGDDDSAEAEP